MTRAQRMWMDPGDAPLDGNRMFDDRNMEKRERVTRASTRSTTGFVILQLLHVCLGFF